VAESLGGTEEVVAIERLEGVGVVDIADVSDVEDTSSVVETLGVLDETSDEEEMLGVFDEVPTATEVPLPGVGVKSVLDSGGVGVLLGLKVVSRALGVEVSGVVSETKELETGAAVGVAEDETITDEGEPFVEGVKTLLLWHLCLCASPSARVANTTREESDQRIFRVAAAGRCGLTCKVRFRDEKEEEEVVASFWERACIYPHAILL
jgi:hypothetical protein